MSSKDSIRTSPTPSKCSSFLRVHWSRTSHRWGIDMRNRLIVCAMLAVSAAGQEPQWIPMFDGKTLKGWKETPFAGKGTVKVEDGAIILGPGAPMTGVTWEG